MSGTYRSGLRITCHDQTSCMQLPTVRDSLRLVCLYSMARGVASPSPASLPKVSFVKVIGENPTTRSGVHDNQQRSYGCMRMCYSLPQVLIVV